MGLFSENQEDNKIQIPETPENTGHIENTKNKGKKFRLIGTQKEIDFSAEAYAAVFVALMLFVMIFFISSLSENVTKLTKENEVLKAEAYSLYEAVDSMTENVTYTKEKTRLQSETIYAQKGSMSSLEEQTSRTLSEYSESLQELTAQKVQIVNDLLYLVKTYDIFSGLKSRQADFYEAINQLTEVEMYINQQFGENSAEAIYLITDLENEKAKAEDYVRRYPDYTPVSTFRLSSPYGWRSDPFTGEMKFHYGIDMACGEGSPVYAAGYGVVKEKGYNATSGNYIVIDHKNGYTTRYCHLSKICVYQGQTVEKASYIGDVGMTGRATGPHLHYEVAINGATQNPIGYVDKTKATNL